MTNPRTEWSGGFQPSPAWRGWTGRSPGRVWGGAGSDLVPPLFRPCGATFPQGKVRGYRQQNIPLPPKQQMFSAEHRQMRVHRSSPKVKPR